MKMIATVAVGLLATCAFAQGSYVQQPDSKAPEKVLRPEINAAQAEKDIQENRIRFYTYGMASITSFKIWDLLKKEYGIEIRGAAGCIVTRDLVARVREYNDRMDKVVVKKYGKTYRQLFDEASEKVQKSQAAPK
ncbi:MAG: hypothetical protein QM758_29890 [Armatimonas sp.]